MMETLRDAGWSAESVTPYGDLEWVDEIWFPAMRNAIVNAAVPVGQSRAANSP